MPPGRKAILQIDPAVQGRIVGYIRAGAFPDRAAAAAGVSERAHYLWQAKGLEERSRREDGKPARKTWQVYLDYLAAIEQAVAEAEMLLIAKAGKGGETGSAAMKLLERRFRERWSSKAAVLADAPAAPGAGAGRASVTTLDQFASRREQRRVQAP